MSRQARSMLDTAAVTVLVAWGLLFVAAALPVPPSSTPPASPTPATLAADQSPSMQALRPE